MGSQAGRDTISVHNLIEGPEMSTRGANLTPGRFCCIIPSTLLPLEVLIHHLFKYWWTYHPLWYHTTILNSCTAECWQHWQKHSSAAILSQHVQKQKVTQWWRQTYHATHFTAFRWKPIFQEFFVALIFGGKRAWLMATVLTRKIPEFTPWQDWI